MKAALCFLISYDNTIHKEEVWKKWIHENRDILNVYIHYDPSTYAPPSPWVRHHCIPKKYITATSYLHIVPAYMNTMAYAMDHDKENQWCCMLTGSCAPIISPTDFRKLFFHHAHTTMMTWKPAWWNVNFHRRANLRQLPPKLRIGHAPWFVMQRSHVLTCLSYPKTNQDMFQLVARGTIANESLFGIILTQHNLMKDVLNYSSHLADWTQMSSTTSPYVFKDGSESETDRITDLLADPENKYAMFLRKVHPDFPDEVLVTIMGNRTIPDDVLSKEARYDLLLHAKILICVVFLFYQLRSINWGFLPVSI